ncbi:MAG: hypothetical protein PHQ86_01895 [Dehalococcoidales bacterium]|nr:hypothetical protein [Dehalococcoidales bacterium]
MTENNPTEFSVIYDGDALKQHTMDVKDLAPALLSLGQAFDRANSLLNGEKADINLNIKALSPGSFDIALILSQTLQGASNAISWDWLTSAINLREVLIGTPSGIIGLVMLIRKLKGKKPKQIETPEGITFEAENIKISVHKDVAKLFNDRITRDLIEGVVRPLQKPGIKTLSFKEKEKVLETVDSSEVEYFTFNGDEGSPKEYIIPRQRLQIDSLKFKKGKWQLNDGAHSNWYLMDDKVFLDSIKKGKLFGMYDILICDVSMNQQILSDGKLKLDYAVKKVINHFRPGEQLPFKAE